MLCSYLFFTILRLVLQGKMLEIKFYHNFKTGFTVFMQEEEVLMHNSSGHNEERSSVVKVF